MNLRVTLSPPLVYISAVHETAKKQQSPLALGSGAVQHLPGYLALLWAFLSFSVICSFTFSSLCNPSPWDWVAKDNRRDTSRSKTHELLMAEASARSVNQTVFSYISAARRGFPASCALECSRGCVPTEFVLVGDVLPHHGVSSALLFTYSSRNFCYQKCLLFNLRQEPENVFQLGWFLNSSPTHILAEFLPRLFHFSSFSLSSKWSKQPHWTETDKLK